MEDKFWHFKLLWSYLKKDKCKLFIYIFLYALLLIPSVAIPYLFGLALDNLVNNGLELFMQNIAFAIILNIVFYCIVAMFINKLYYEIEKKVSNEIMKDIYIKVNKLPAIAFEQIAVGEFSNRLYTDPNTIVELAFEFLNSVYFIIKTLIIFAIIFSVSFILGIEALLFTLAMFVITKHFMPKIKKNQEKISKSGDELLKSNTENLHGIREIRSLGINNILTKKVFKNVESYTDAKKEINLKENYYYTFNNFVFYGFQFMIFMTLGSMYVNSVITIAIYTMVQTYIWNLDYAATRISKMGSSYSKIIVALKRIDEIVNNKLYEDEKFGDKTLNNTLGIVEFKNVDFKYKDEEDLVLNNFSAYFKPNQKNAIIGRSGNGKSTLFNLLLRYFDAFDGEILIDGTNLTHLTEKSLRENISVISQQPFLFNETIKENFKMVMPKVTDEKIIEVCKKAYIHDYIMSLKNGYNTVIGEGGVNLSGGQKQRIAIARTLLLDTKIILFDEATSALDNEAQNYVKKTIDELTKNHTIIIVAHRLSTIVDADEIFVVDKGSLAASGSHKQLIKNNEVYQTLYKNEELIK